MKSHSSVNGAEHNTKKRQKRSLEIGITAPLKDTQGRHRQRRDVSPSGRRPTRADWRGPRPRPNQLSPWRQRLLQRWQQGAQKEIRPTGPNDNPQQKTNPERIGKAQPKPIRMNGNRESYVGPPAFKSPAIEKRTHEVSPHQGTPLEQRPSPPSAGPPVYNFQSSQQMVQPNKKSIPMQQRPYGQAPTNRNSHTNRNSPKANKMVDQTGKSKSRPIDSLLVLENHGGQPKNALSTPKGYVEATGKTISKRILRPTTRSPYLLTASSSTDREHMNIKKNLPSSKSLQNSFNGGQDSKSSVRNAGKERFAPPIPRRRPKNSKDNQAKQKRKLQFLLIKAKLKGIVPESNSDQDLFDAVIQYSSTLDDGPTKTGIVTWLKGYYRDNPYVDTSVKTTTTTTTTTTTIKPPITLPTTRVPIPLPNIASHIIKLRQFIRARNIPLTTTTEAPQTFPTTVTVTRDIVTQDNRPVDLAGMGSLRNAYTGEYNKRGFYKNPALSSAQYATNMNPGSEVTSDKYKIPLPNIPKEPFDMFPHNQPKNGPAIVEHENPVTSQSNINQMKPGIDGGQFPKQPFVPTKSLLSTGNNIENSRGTPSTRFGNIGNKPFVRPGNGNQNLPSPGRGDATYSRAGSRTNAKQTNKYKPNRRAPFLGPTYAQGSRRNVDRSSGRPTANADKTNLPTRNSQYNVMGRVPSAAHQGSEYHSSQLHALKKLPKQTTGNFHKNGRYMFPNRKSGKPMAVLSSQNSQHNMMPFKPNLAGKQVKEVPSTPEVVPQTEVPLPGKRNVVTKPPFIIPLMPVHVMHIPEKDFPKDRNPTTTTVITYTQSTSTYSEQGVYKPETGAPFVRKSYSHAQGQRNVYNSRPLQFIYLSYMLRR